MRGDALPIQMAGRGSQRSARGESTESGSDDSSRSRTGNQSHRDCARVRLKRDAARECAAQTAPGQNHRSNESGPESDGEGISADVRDVNEIPEAGLRGSAVAARSEQPTASGFFIEKRR